MLNPSQKKGFSIQRMSKVKTLQNLEGKIFLDFYFFFLLKTCITKIFTKTPILHVLS